MSEKCIKLRSISSNEDMNLYIQKGENDGEEEYYFTLCGRYKKEEDIQIDFEYFTPESFRNFISECYKLLKDHQ